jgi:hypothetical protein
MKNIGIIVLILFLLISCQTKQERKPNANESKSNQVDDKSITNHDSLFMLKVENSENLIRIIPPKNSDFELPDSSAATKSFKNGDFNADEKEDILIYMGACGTGGCMYGLFLNQYDNYYKLAYFSYLKNAEFEIEKNGMWAIYSGEELEPYNPSKIQVTIFKFNKNTYQYELDTTYLYYDKETEAIMNK